MATIKPKKYTGRQVYETRLVEMQGKKYIVEIGIHDIVLDYYEVETDKPGRYELQLYGNSTIYKMQASKMKAIENIKYIELQYYIDQEVNERELRNMMLKVIVKYKKGLTDSELKRVCTIFDKCEKLVRSAYMDYSNLNEANVAYRMLVKKYEEILLVIREVIDGVHKNKNDDYDSYKKYKNFVGLM